MGVTLGGWTLERPSCGGFVSFSIALWMGKGGPWLQQEPWPSLSSTDKRLRSRLRGTTDRAGG